MDKALYISMSGAKQNMFAQRSHANNLANANTTGFREDFAQARSQPVWGDYHPTRAYAMTERPASNFKPGAMMETGRDLDIAIPDRGFFVVQDPEGNEALTRAGNFVQDVNGQLLTPQGLSVMGEDGPIFIPPASQINVANDGTISLIPAEGQAADVVELGRLKLVNPEIETLDKGTDGLFRVKDQPGVVFEQDPTVQVTSGFLESSNVNTINAMTEMMSHQRQYELQVKMMKTTEENAEKVASLLQIQ
ncbi:flagellar basal-body rod protein FlgF [Litoribrevibacter euphylliae]|uniref:Flagellar basal-body rod protein FlgF n=1 Tax=Litoribrevibacter euphylliae TaxID=1834034 RepID=A0ABV7HF90_9GAMM